MDLKKILTFNIEDTKIGRVLIIGFGLLLVGLIIADQFSVENRCRRQVTRLMNMLPPELRSNSLAVETVIDSEVRDCVEEANKSKP